MRSRHFPILLLQLLQTQWPPRFPVVDCISKTRAKVERGLVVGISKKSLAGFPSRSPEVRVAQVPTRGPHTQIWESLVLSGTLPLFLAASLVWCSEKKIGTQLKWSFFKWISAFFWFPNLRVWGRPMAGSLICESPLAKICQNASRGPALSRESSYH